MLIIHAIVAAIAVGALAARPNGDAATCVVAGAALTDLVLGAGALPVVSVVAPLIAFLGAALTLAGLVERSGLAERAAGVLAVHARGSALLLYALVCATCALLTAAISLDGAVVLMVPVLTVLARRFGAPFAPLFLGTVVVANAVSLAVPEGNPTNLVIISRLGLSATAFVEHMILPGLAAALVCAIGVALSERQALATPLRVSRPTASSLSGGEWHAAISLGFAALAALASLLAGMSPWWPFAGAVALALALGARRERPVLVIPWRVTVQVAGLLITTEALGLTVRAPGALSLVGLLAVAGGVGAASALANNLPVSVCATGLLTAGAPAYAASVGLAVGSLATPQGSVATLIAGQLAGRCAPPLEVRRFAPLAAASLVAATLLLWMTL